jgi:hypothetical protein
MLRAAAIVTALLLVTPATAQDAAVSLEGKVKQAKQFTVEALKKMPAEHAEVSFQSERGTTKASYTGVLLWSLIEAAGGIDDDPKGAALRHAIRITAKDGFSSLSRPVSSLGLISSCRQPFALRLLMPHGALASLRGRRQAAS